ncbi:MAG: ABC transporter permease [Alphaproteobacteria bacterium]|nr:ABC transporter permease [Alphaproteobacteria bacterium]
MREFIAKCYAVWALIIKEFQMIWSDPKNRGMILLPPLLMLTVFAFAATFEVNNISMVIYDKDNTPISQALIDKIAHTPYVKNLYFVNNPNELQQKIDTEKAFVALTIPDDFAKKTILNESPTVQLILDGRKSNTAQVVSGYLTQIFAAFQYETNGVDTPQIPIKIQVRNWFNPELNYQWYIVISFMGVLVTVMMLAITALSVAQEKELGTFEQVLISPLTPFQILIGKTIPAITIAYLDFTIMLIAGRLLFHIPAESGYLLIYACIFVFLFSIAGIGLFISTICNTQQQAIFGVFAFLAPTFLLSGFITPIENMPLILQKFSIINPLTYFFRLARGLFLKNIDAVTIWLNVWPLLIIGLCTLSFAAWFFNKRIN